MKSPIIVAVVGLTGSGKTEATQQFIARGFARFGYNDVIYEELARLGLERNEKNERHVREGLRREFGLAMAAVRKLPSIKEAVDAGSNVAIESLYTWSEYKATREVFGENFKALAVYAPPAIRYARLAARSVRALDRNAALARDYAQIENLEQGGPIAMADWTIENAGTKEELLKKIDTLIDQLV